MDMTYSQEQVEAWCLHPKFSSHDLLNHHMPENIEEEGAALWQKIIGSRDFPQFISETGFDVTHQSMLAGGRVLSLEKLYKVCSQWPTLLVLLAECHFLLNDSRGARMYAEEAQSLLGLGHDNFLDGCVFYLRILEQQDLNYEGTDDDDVDAEAISVFHYERPADYIKSLEPSNLVQLQLRWALLQQQHDGDEQFARLACVQTNELEDVFDLDGDSTMKLALRGFYANSIFGFSHQSRVKSKEKILRILRNTQTCLSHVKAECMDNKSPSSCISESFLKDLHLRLLDGNNLEITVDEYGAMTTYVPTGRYRGVAGYTTTEQSDGTVLEVRYCPPARLNEEMDWYVKKVRNILMASRGETDPFRACAWIQWAFVRIHPFADGNGRMSRLVSSIPLILNDLPPVYVAKSSKPRYLKALIDADKTGDIDDLARFLQDEVFDALGQLLESNNVNIHKATLDLLSSSSMTSSMTNSSSSNDSG